VVVGDDVVEGHDDAGPVEQREVGVDGGEEEEVEVVAGDGARERPEVGERAAALGRGRLGGRYGRGGGNDLDAGGKGGGLGRLAVGEEHVLVPALSDERRQQFAREPPEPPPVRPAAGVDSDFHRYSFANDRAP
jgi:hypothetical protein